MRPLLPLAALLLAACVEPLPVEPAALADLELAEVPSGPRVEVGGGREVFEELEVGHTLEVERGPQGGQHIWASLRAWGVDAGSDDDYEAMLNQDRPIVEFQLLGADGDYAFVNAFPRRLEPTDEGHELLGRLVQFRHWVELPEDWEQIDWDEREAQLEQEELLLRVVLEEADGDVFVDECAVYLDFPPRGDGDVVARYRPAM